MKKLFFTLLLAISLKADALEDKIENILGTYEYDKHKGLINILFKEKSKFYINDKLRYMTILNELKRNGLLKLEFPSPKEFELEFQTSKDPIKSLKILNNTLKSLGYNYYFTKSSKYDGEGNLSWTIAIKSRNALDPLVFSKELLKKDCKVIDIKREENDKWVYKIDTNFAKISEAIFVDTNERVVLQKPLKPYFLQVRGDGTKLRVISRKLNTWFPYVVFYDTHLNVLKVIKKDKIFRGATIKIPENSKYIKISDLYTLMNIKRGISVIIKE